MIVYFGQIDFVALLKHLFWEAQINESWSVVVPDLEYLGKVGRWISQIPAEYRSRYAKIIER